MPKIISRSKKMPLDVLTIRHLHTSVEGKDILKGIDLSIRAGEVHAIMGPNGSGKSTLAYALMGHSAYKCQMSNVKCQMRIGKKDLFPLTTQERAKAGLFLALQSPIAIPGVSVVNLLRTSYQEIYNNNKKLSVKSGHSVRYNPALSSRWNLTDMTFQDFMNTLKRYAQLLHIDETFLKRGIHDGFSGGEKKKIEMLQALVLRPKFAIFDEIDTGLDIDALTIVSKGIKELVKEGTGVIIITHYQRILRYIRPDRVHILVNGRIVKTGSADLAKKIEEKGYKQYLRSQITMTKSQHGGKT